MGGLYRTLIIKKPSEPFPHLEKLSILPIKFLGLLVRYDIQAPLRTILWVKHYQRSLVEDQNLDENPSEQLSIIL